MVLLINWGNQIANRTFRHSRVDPTRTDRPAFRIRLFHSLRGAPSVASLQDHFARTFNVSAAGYTLSEQTAIIEQRTKDRAQLISALRSQFSKLKPTGAVLNLPLYNWKTIFTTNYDLVVEEAYKRRSRPIATYSSNFDFGTRQDTDTIQYFKLHGTIEKDVSDGSQSRIILTENDYDLAAEYREQLFDRLQADLAGAHLVIIGHSLADPDIKAVVDRALQLAAKSGGAGRITLFSYSRDEGRAEIFESRGIQVCFGGLDDFFAGLAKRINIAAPTIALTGDPLDIHTALRPATIDVAHAAGGAPNAGAMYNGWAASYSDIANNLTFGRDVADEVYTQLQNDEKPIAIVLGAGGVGKTTAARQVMHRLQQQGFFCWEHKADQVLLAIRWRELASTLKKDGLRGCLLIDEAHLELSEINDLVDYLASDQNKNFRLLLTSSLGHWRPRIKTPAFHKRADEYHLRKVQGVEIDRLLTLIESTPAIGALIEDDFAGFSKLERRRRLVERCEADMFVCLKNIFSSSKLDDIILREFAGLDKRPQEIYRVVAAMESAGVRVHRQLIIRLLGISASSISSVLESLSDIIHEYPVNEREGIYAWRGRHKVIMEIVAEHKYYDKEKRYDLFSKVIDAISPTYDIEIRTIRELCNVESGLPTIGDKEKQNILLRKMLSAAPRERVPRHRLIRNLIDLTQYDKADTEIRLFEKDFKLDGPATRYKVDLALARAVGSPGIMLEDRLVLLEKARELAAAAASRYKDNKAVIASYCDVGLAIMRLAGEASAFENAVAAMRRAEENTGDPDISRLISRYESRFMAIQVDSEIVLPPEDLID